MTEYTSLTAEWRSWVFDWSLDGYILSQLERVPHGMEKIEAFIAEYQKELDDDPSAFSHIAITKETGGEEEEEEEEEETRGDAPLFATAGELERWNRLAPQYPHPYLMLLFGGKAREIEEEYIIASMPEKAVVALATLANWQPFDASLKVEITPLLGGWKVNDIISRWLKAHPDANLQNIPDLDGNPRWCRKV